MAAIKHWQVQTIHITRRQIWGEDRDSYENMLSGTYGAGSCKDLSYREANDFIDRLKAHRDGKPMPPLRRGSVWASMEQVNKIEALSAMLAWDEERENGFIKRQTKRNSTRWMLTVPQATKVIIGQQKVLAKGSKEVYDWLNSATSEILRSEFGKAKREAIKN